MSGHAAVHCGPHLGCELKYCALYPNQCKPYLKNLYVYCLYTIIVLLKKCYSNFQVHFVLYLSSFSVSSLTLFFFCFFAVSNIVSLVLGHYEQCIVLWLCRPLRVFWNLWRHISTRLRGRKCKRFDYFE